MFATLCHPHMLCGGGRKTYPCMNRFESNKKKSMTRTGIPVVAPGQYQAGGFAFKVWARQSRRRQRGGSFLAICCSFRLIDWLVGIGRVKCVD